MKALTIRQPWATLIALGVKTIETRSWRSPASLIGQRLAIHAGAALPSSASGCRSDDQPEWTIDEAFGWSPQMQNWLGVLAWRGPRSAPVEALFSTVGPDTPMPLMTDLPLGAIVATATLTDYLPMVDTDHRGHHLRSLLICPSGLFRSDRSSQDDDYDLTDQLPYGWFAPGRWAWMLDDIKLCDLVPAKGKQGVWEWLP